MKRLNLIQFLMAVILTVFLSGITACQPASTGSTGKPLIVVTYSVLGSLIKDLVGDKADVIVSIPNGLDMHEWEPSAKDIETINKADLVIENGLNLEEGMENALDAARHNGVKFFTVSDHITVRYIGADEEVHSHEPEADEETHAENHEHEAGAADPHTWLDPLTMMSVVQALAPVLKQELGLDVSERAPGLESRLVMLDAEIMEKVSHLPVSERKLVTGHQSMGYFAGRYSFRQIGVIVPSLSSQAEVSAADLAALKTQIEENQVKAIFTELGTSPAVAKAIGDETGVKVVELTTHALPSDGSYFTFMTDLANTIVDALK